MIATLDAPPSIALASMLPEGILLLGIAVVLVADALLPSDRERRSTWIGLAAAVLATVAAALQTPTLVPGMLALDGIALLVRPVLAATTALLLLARRGEPLPPARDDAAWTTSVLGIGIGALLLAAADSVLPFWLGLETISVASYALVAWRADRRSAEAGMKFVLFGGAATATMLLGISHLYGLTGHFDFAGIGRELGGGMPLPALVALLLAATGAAYKLTLVPFHFYAPDVYEGAPATSLAATAAVPKIAVVAAALRAANAALQGPLPGNAEFANGLALVATASLLAAAVLALVQRDGKRILAFSGIGHAGAIALAFAGLPAEMAAANALYYLIAYAAANTGALLCLAVLERACGGTSLTSLRGAIRLAPKTTAALCLFLFSLAGMPPLAGFFAKWAVLQQALRLAAEGKAAPAWAAAALLASTAIAAWSYLLVIRAVALGGSDDDAPAAAAAPTRASAPLLLAIAVCAAATLGLGLWLDCAPAIGRALRP